MKLNTEDSLWTTTKDYPPGVRGPHRWQEAHWVLIPAGTSHQSPLHFADQLGGGGGVGKELSARVVVGICCSDEKFMKPLACRPCPSPKLPEMSTLLPPNWYWVEGKVWLPDSTPSTLSSLSIRRTLLTSCGVGTGVDMIRCSLWRRLNSLRWSTLCCHSRLW